MDRFAQLDVPGWIAGLQAALAADSSYLPALLDFLGPSQGRLHPAGTPALDSVARRPSHPLSLCARVVLDGLERFMPVPAPAASVGVAACGPLAQVVDQTSRLSATERADLWEAVRRDYPEAVLATMNALGEMAAAGDWNRIAGIAKAAAGSPIAQIRLLGREYLALALHQMGRHSEARAMERRALDEVRKGGEGLRTLSMDISSNHSALRSDTLGSNLTAHLDSLARALAAWSDTRPLPVDPWLRLQLRLGVARGRLDRGDLTGSLRESERAVSLADSIGDPGGRVMAYTLRGRAAVKAGALVLAERSLLAARQHAAAWGPGELQYEVEHNLLHLYEGLGRWADARQAGLNFVAATGRARLTPVRMMSHRDLGWFLRRRGEWEDAKRHFEAMVATIDSLSLVHDYPFFAGEYFESVGDLERARIYYTRVTETGALPRALEALARLAEATGDTLGAIDLATRLERIRVEHYPEYRSLLPGVLARAGRYAEAVEGFERARRAATERGQVASWARLSTELARVEHDRGHFERAAALGDSAATAARQVADREFAVRASAISASARVRLRIRSIVAELSRLSGLGREARRLRAPALELEVALLEGGAHATLGDVAAALATYRIAQALADSIASGLEPDPSRAGYRAAQLAPSNQALTLATVRRRHPGALRWWVEWSGRRKGRELRPPALAGSRATTFKAPPGVVIVDFAVLDSLVAALVVTRDTTSIEVLPIAPSAVRAALASLYAGVAPRVGGAIDRGRARVDHRAMAQLGAGLLEPLVSRIGDARALVIVPDGPLHLVPFDALPISPVDTAELVLDRYLVHLAPTLAAARAGPGELPDGGVVLAAGDGGMGPVPGLEREVAGIQETVTRRSVTQLSGAHATEARVRAEARGAAILHFAAHARPNYHNPDMSDVLLSPGDGHDGRLQVHEIRRLPLSGALVVLSACETAGGRVVAGEGPLSLSRAFLQAGARQVVATLWPVGAATADVMTDFYGAVEAGHQPAEALRAAKHAARAAGLDPLAWVPFTVVVAR